MYANTLNVAGIPFFFFRKTDEEVLSTAENWFCDGDKADPHSCENWA